MSEIFSSDVNIEPGTNPITIQGGNSTAVKTDGSAVTQPVSGTITVTQPTGTNLHTVVDSGSITTTPTVSSTSTLTQVTPTANTNTQLIASNANRKKVILYFPKGNSTTFIKFGVTASATSWTITIFANNTLVVETMWQGEIDYFGQAQTVNITELT